MKPIVHTPGHVRAYEATLNRAYPRVFSDVKLWAQVGGQTHVKSNIRTETPEACLETRAVFHNPSILTNARVSFGHADSAEIQIKLSFDCDVSTIVSEPYPINSTYVSGYQQIVNSDYVTLQWELQQAQSEVADLKRRHAANPPVNGWLAAAYGLAEGLAQGKVNKISQKLRQTSPYLSEPIKLAYAAEGYGATRSARLSVAIQLHDSKTMFDDAIYLSATSESSDTGTMNVLPSDAQGLVNRQPSLKEDRVLLEESFAKFQSHMDAAARDLLARAFIDRARGSVKDHVALVGNLLLARDVMPESIDSLNANAILERLSGSNLNELTAMKIDATTIRFPPRSPTKNAETAPAKPSTSVRSAAIEKALASVVTVRTPSGFGTGFFANDRGFIITNLHVVRGPGKVTVHTRDGSTFLATVVKSSENPDLALIKISGFTAPPLSVADSDNVEVGSDVLAVGSPKGLEGSVTKGIISARRKIEGVRYFQVDAAINPGNSGGPLLNENGQVIGINTAKRSEGESLGFAIEINEARALFSEFLEN